MEKVDDDVRSKLNFLKEKLEGKEQNDEDFVIKNQTEQTNDEKDDQLEQKNLD